MAADTQRLFELQRFIRQVFSLNFPEPVWVRAEIASFSESKGHLFLQLVDKESPESEIRAEAQAIAWQGQLRKLKRQQGKNLEILYQQGIEVRIQVRPEFHERFGLSLIIEDVDIDFSLGQLAISRKKHIETLRKEGLIEKNGQLALPPVLQSLAIISSPNAAGLQDFLQQLQKNPFDYAFKNKLFPASMQGQHVRNEVIAQFNRIQREPEKFDAVIIIRGGGSRTDLLAFDDLDLARAAARLPIPLLTGIGHDINESLLDMVAHSPLKTPTAAADFILRKNMQFESTVTEIGKRIFQATETPLFKAQHLLERTREKIHLASRLILQQGQANIDASQAALKGKVEQILRLEKLNLHKLDDQIKQLDPKEILKRGYVLLEKDGKRVKSVSSLKTGDTVKSILIDGVVYAKIDRKEKE